MTLRTTPVDVAGLGSGVAALAAGGVYTCALTAVGGIKCWGFNIYGQLGDGTTTSPRLTPVDVTGLASGVAALAAGPDHACALTAAGGVKCWGRNDFGQLGDGTTSSRLTPVDVSGLGSGVAAIAAGLFHTCALTTGGGIKCWGDNGSGQLGDGTTTTHLTPVDVSGLGSRVAVIAVGANHTCAVTAGGGVKCWGDNDAGQLGINRLWIPVDVVGFGGGQVSAVRGQVTHHDHSPIADVTVSDGAGHSKATDAMGNYEFTGLAAGMYTFTAAKSGYAFSPPSRVVSLPPDAAGQDFVGLSSGIEITRMEITQATQCMDDPDCFGASHSAWCSTTDCSNAVPLLRNKATWVRVYIKGEQDGTQVLGFVRGYSQNGVELPGQIVLSQVTGHPNGGDRGKASDSLNFRLPTEWTRHDNIGLETVIFERLGPATDSREMALTSSMRRTVKIHVWRLRYIDSPAATRQEALAETQFTTQVYPASDIRLTDEGELLVSAKTWPELTKELATPCGALRANLGDAEIRCYGWVPEGATIKSSDGKTYFGWTDHKVSVGYVYRPPLASGVRNLAPQYIMAHEIGHRFPPLGHVATASCGGSGGGQFGNQYPNATGSIGEYGFYDDGTARVYVPQVALPDHPTSSFDFMSYCGVNDNRQWVSPYTYRHLYEALGAPDLVGAVAAPAADTQPYLIASGVITPSGSISLDHFYQEQYPVGSYDTPGTGAYRLELQDTQGDILFTRFFDQTAPEWIDVGAAPIHFFEIMPLAPGTSKVLVKQDATTLGQVLVSPNPPQLTLIQPQPGVVSSNTLQIAWTGSDLDGDEIEYMVEYNADGGLTWRTLASSLVDSTLTVKTEDLPGSNQARIRVLASDGLNTSTVDSGVLVVATKMPWVSILTPHDGVVLQPGQPVHLSGIAQDREDGPLDGAALTWTLDDSTAIGTGTQLTLFSPPTGWHEITLTADDNTGSKASTSVSVFVGHQVYLPLTVRSQ
jgi:hypothetical protein